LNQPGLASYRFAVGLVRHEVRRWCCPHLSCL